MIQTICDSRPASVCPSSCFRPLVSSIAGVWGLGVGPLDLEFGVYSCWLLRIPFLVSFPGQTAGGRRQVQCTMYNLLHSMYIEDLKTSESHLLDVVHTHFSGLRTANSTPTICRTNRIGLPSDNFTISFTVVLMTSLRCPTAYQVQCTFAIRPRPRRTNESTFQCSLFSFKRFYDLRLRSRISDAILDTFLLHLTLTHHQSSIIGHLNQVPSAALSPVATIIIISLAINYLPRSLRSPMHMVISAYHHPTMKTIHTMKTSTSSHSLKETEAKKKGRSITFGSKEEPKMRRSVSMHSDLSDEAIFAEFERSLRQSLRNSSMHTSKLYTSSSVPLEESAEKSDHSMSHVNDSEYVLTSRYPSKPDPIPTSTCLGRSSSHTEETVDMNDSMHVCDIFEGDVSSLDSHDNVHRPNERRRSRQRQHSSLKDLFA